MGLNGGSDNENIGLNIIEAKKRKRGGIGPDSWEFNDHGRSALIWQEC